MLNYHSWRDTLIKSPIHTEQACVVVVVVAVLMRLNSELVNNISCIQTILDVNTHSNATCLRQNETVTTRLL